MMVQDCHQRVTVKIHFCDNLLICMLVDGLESSVLHVLPQLNHSGIMLSQ